MLKEVCKTVLVVCFLECTGISSEVELGPLSWFVVVEEVISQSVGKLSSYD